MAQPALHHIERHLGGTLSAQAYRPGHGWVGCLRTRAQGWFAKPKRGLGRRFARRSDALAFLDRALRLQAPTRRSGAGAPVARSLTKLEWLAAQQSKGTNQ